MQKIDKNLILSNNYKIWHDELGDIHPEYDSSNNKFYFDIKMSLLYCQKGLCAYTEELLCEKKYFDSINWDKNKYVTELTQEEKNEVQGDLEHFDESLKSQKAWLWDNLFIVNIHVNRNIKKSQSIKNILKPDLANYDPYRCLNFDYDLGVFFPNINLKKQEKDDVEYMIQVLGLNYLHGKRKKQLKEWVDMKEVGLQVSPYQFITAWNMTLKNL